MLALLYYGGHLVQTRHDAPVFTDLTFTVKPGVNVAVVGRSGSGKSTIAQLLLRFYDPEKGAVFIDDYDIRSLDPGHLRNDLIAYVPQEPSLFAASIKENISYGKPDATHEEIIAAADLANASAFIENFPHGFDTFVGEKGMALSGGQILILDEATSALDAASEYLVQDAMSKIIKGRTVITIAHRLSTIMQADQIIMIDRGKVIESGTYEELTSKPDATAKYRDETSYCQAVDMELHHRLCATFLFGLALFGSSAGQITTPCSMSAKAFERSPEHDANLKNSAVRISGYGFTNGYWTQDFADEWPSTSSYYVSCPVIPASRQTWVGRIKTYPEGLCLDGVYGQGYAMRANKCNPSSTSQLFTLQPTGLGSFTIYAGFLDLCADVFGYASRNGAVLGMWPCNGQLNQQYWFKSDGTISPAHATGLCTELANNSPHSANTSVSFWTCNSGNNQRWVKAVTV
ncbi:ATP-binding cassette sub- B member 10, mitochondrial [Cladochytrium tenue]|nr:ATP-binding cassette sub- B member 10, mitochondrial [Cladochytrium tenue]